MATIDTLKYYKELTGTGISDDQAQAQVYALTNTVGDLATKDDLYALEARIDLKIDQKFDMLEVKITEKINTMRTLGWALFVAISLPTIKSLF